MRSTELYRLIREIRAAFQDLKAYADRLHADSGVNASMRAVLEHLADEGAASVPQMARKKNVSRQHIQTIVDRLRENDLVALRENPAHKRSVLIAMTGKGRKAYRMIREKEQIVMRELRKTLDADQVAAAVAVIGQLRNEIKTLEEAEDAKFFTR